MPDSNLKDIIDKYYKRQFNFKEQYDILQFLKSNPQLGDPNPVILDADDLLNNPEVVLSQYCQAVGIPYTDSLLQWKSGIDVVKNWKISRELIAGGLFAKGEGFYKTAFESSEFRPPKKLPEREELDDDVLKCADMGLPYYEEMYRMRTILPWGKLDKTS